MNIRQSRSDLSSIQGRLKSERVRLGYSQKEFGILGGRSMRGYQDCERGLTFPTADFLAGVAEAGADVLFIITGETAVVASEALAGVTVRQALAMLDPADRHRLLLDLLAGELAA